MASNFLKKIDKKQRRHQHTVSRQLGVKCSQTPTKHLAICNAGQINGLTEDMIFSSFTKYGELEKILLIPGKSSACLTFNSVVSATEAYENTNGCLNIAQDGKPIYLSFIESLPDLKSEKIFGRPPGLLIFENFISENEEAALLSSCHFSGNMKNRQVKHFGYEFRYDINNVDKNKPLPEQIPRECDFLWDRLKAADCDFKDFIPDQLTVNEYKPGQGIPLHVDTHSAFEDPILSLSLGSKVTMEFKGNNETFCVLLPQRSLAILSGECRYNFTHGIIPKTFDFFCNDSGCYTFKRGTRVSFTFRKILEGECHCTYNAMCDSYLKGKITIENDTASKLESLHVHKVYEDIALHFSDTRHKPWPNILNFIGEFEVGSVLVDVGCGNGKYFGHNREIFELGLDHSHELSKVCMSRGFQTSTANCLHIPLKDNTADGVISIAVIHHLSTEERRLQAIQEILRILRPGGSALIYVWAKEQVKNNEKSTYIKQDRKNRKTEVLPSDNGELYATNGIALPVHRARTDFNHSDVLVPWKLKSDKECSQTLLRFYHVFEEGELDELCKKIRGIIIVRSYYDQGNYCVLFKKV